MGGPIYVPPDAAGNPFASRRDGGRRRLWAIAIGGAVLLIGAAAAVVATGGGGDLDARPGPLTAALAQTDWRWSADPATGYRRLSTPFGADTTFDRIAANAEGTLAIAARLRGEEPWVLVWERGQWQGRPFPDHDAVTALGVDPEGVVHVGFSDGALARVGTGGEVADEGVVASGYSIVGFAFDRESRRSALMLSGGEVRTGLRPLQRSALHTVPMPPRARIRTLAYSADGDLVVAGDAGAVFVSSDDGWQSGSLPTSGNVTALGLSGDGDLLVAQSNGHVFAGSGITWDRVGQISAAPVAVGELPEHGVVVASSNGRIYATLGRDDFSEVPGYQAPSSFVAQHGSVAGHNVILAGSDRLLVWDGELFESRSAAVPDGTLPGEGCEAVGPASLGIEGLPPFAFDCGEGRHAVVEGGDLADVEQLRLGDRAVAAVDFVRGAEQARRRGATWVAGEPWAPAPRGQLPAIQRWDAETGQWDLVAPFDVEEGDVLAVSAAVVGDAWEVWAVLRSGAVHFARVATDATDAPPAFERVVEHVQLQAHYGDDFFPHSVELHALGSARALLVHDGWRATRVAHGNAEVEPLALFDGVVPPASPRFHRVPGGVAVVSEDAIRLVGATAPATKWTVPGGESLLLRRYARSSFDAAVRENVVVLRTGRGLLRCRAGTCAPVELPAWARPTGVAFAPDGRVVVLEPGGLVGMIEPRGGA